MIYTIKIWLSVVLLTLSLFVSGVAQTSKITPLDSTIIVPPGAPGMVIYHDRVIASSLMYYSNFIITEAPTGKVVHQCVFWGVETVFFTSLKPGLYYAILVHGRNQPPAQIWRVDTRLFLVQ